MQPLYRYDGAFRYGTRPFAKVFRGAPLTAAACISLTLALAGCGAALRTPYEAPTLSVSGKWERDEHESGNPGADRKMNAKVAPDQTVAGTSSSAATDDDSIAQLSAPPEWWNTFQDDRLAGLIRQGLADNPAIRETLLQLQIARQSVGESGAARLPTARFSLNGQASRALSGRHREHSATRRYQTTGGLDYVIDVWGELDRTTDAALAAAESSEFSSQAVQLAQIGEVAQSYWNIAFQHDQITLAKADIAAFQQIVELTKVRAASGRATSFDIAEAQSAVVSAISQLEQHRQEREQHRRTLALLLNKPHTTRLPELSTLANVFVPEIKPDLPVNVITRRPDLLAHEATIRQRLGSYDAARLRYLPRFQVSAELQTHGAKFSDLLSNPVGTLIGTVAFPILNWPTLRFQTERARLEVDIAKNNYERHAYRALSEVQEQLAAQVFFAGEATRLKDMLQASQQLARREALSYSAGRTPLRDWLDRKQRVRDIQRQVLANQRNQLTTRMQLYVRLGGAPEA